MNDEDKPKKLVCPACGAKRWTIEQMKKHIRDKHGGKKK